MDPDGRTLLRVTTEDAAADKTFDMVMGSEAAPGQTLHPDPRPPHRPSQPGAQETRVGHGYAVFRQTCPLGDMSIWLRDCPDSAETG